MSEGTLSAIVFRVAAPQVAAQAQALVGRGASLDDYAMLLVHRSSPHHATLDREGAHVLDDGTVLRLEPRGVATTWLHAHGHDEVARNLDEMAGGEKLFVATLCDDTAELYWIGKPPAEAMHKDRGVRLLPAASDVWDEEHLANLGMDLVLAAHELALALERGAPPTDAVYVRVETDCPLHAALCAAINELPIAESLGPRAAGVPLTAVMSRGWLDETLKGRVRSGIGPAKPGCVGLLRMTKTGVVGQDVRLVQMTQPDAGESN